MSAVWVMLFWVGSGNAGGPASAEFSTQAACVQAIATARQTFGSTYFNAVCIEQATGKHAS